MSSYDPRTPIIKATESETDEVSGHIKHMRGPEQEPVEWPRFETEDTGDASEVEGHWRGRLSDAEAPVEKRLSATEDEQDDDPEVEGHRGFLAR